MTGNFLRMPSRTSLWMSLRLSVCVWSCVAVSEGALAAPFVPDHPDEVVERLPSRATSVANRQSERQLRQRLAADPSSLPTALQAARLLLQRARLSGDPRELGQAQAALAPWWRLPDPPAPVRLMRAMVWQSQHRFEAALQDLDVLVTSQSVPLAVRAQAVLTRTSVLQVLGRWALAQASCAQLKMPEFSALGDGVAVPASVCAAELASLQGDTVSAVVALKGVAEGLTDAGTRRWVALVRAELAERVGDARAGALYQTALGEAPEVYTLAAYADWLLAHGREKDVAVLLNGREEADPLLLRLAIAWTRLRDPRAVAAATILQQRFDAASLRKEASHRREQAMFELDVRGDARAALPHAQANWADQKEPADALLLARAAGAAQQPAAADPVWRFVRDNGFTDVRLNAARKGATR